MNNSLLKVETGTLIGSIGRKSMPRTAAEASCPCLACTPLPRKRAQSGAALILVLACLIFISTLTVAFLISMRTKVVLSKSGYDLNEVQMLAETAVNVAISQVRDATKKAGTNNLAWASQPGMIRLYDNSGSPAGYYKLYSADNMVATSGAFNSGTTSPTDPVPVGWAGAPAVYTDLNAPANGVFPILDYAAATDPSLNIQGISLAGTVPGATVTNPAPMPVKWLYVLKDGSLQPPDVSSSGTKAVIPAATPQNPIVGRIAFWADDETCKVNINTASLGTFWSTPRYASADDQQFARSQPARGEYQRYPGHPATVSLNAVFPGLTATNIFSLTPRYTDGGSKGGTVPNQNITSLITTGTNRLYDSVDEMLFLPPTAGGSRQPNTGITAAMVKASRFFLTASSRAPELNLFGLPRIVTWPISAHSDTNYRTVDDRVIAFCGTLGPAGPATNYPFYFTRQENVLPTYDITLLRNRQLLDYLDRLTGLSVPGFGGSFQTKYTQAESRQILTEIFDYIRCTNLTDKTTPQEPANSGNYPYTFGLSSYGGLPKGSQNNGWSRSLGTAAPAYDDPTVSASGRTGWGTRGFGGRFLQVSSAHLHFVGLGNATVAIDPLQRPPLNPSITLGPGISAGGTTSGNATAVQAFIYLSTLNPSEGIEYWSPGHWVEIAGLDQFGIELDPASRMAPGVPVYTNLGFPATGTSTIMGPMMGGGGIAGARIIGLDPFGFTYAVNALKMLTKVPPADPRSHFPFFSFILPVSSTSPTMAFKGGPITIRIYAEPPYPTVAPYSAHGALIQELSVTFPDAVFPTPILATNRVVGSGDQSGTNERWKQTPRQYFEPTADVLRSIPLADGDLRQLVGPPPAASAPFFQAQADYSDSTKRMVPSANAGGLDYSSNGKLIANAAHQQIFPWVPGHINGVSTTTGAPGDWDNGTAKNVADGPFINAADSGSVKPGANVGDLPYFDNSNTTASSQIQFASPNRQMPGPGMFGSLPTGVQRRLPWQTLLFRPGPANHPGLGTIGVTPPDHLFLDLFWMPVVEPYAISEPFSTAGKINMNQQLVPFTYIDRTAGLQAAMLAEQVAMVSKANAGVYKVAPVAQVRFPLNLSETNGTLRQFKEKFDSGEIFRSASEICDIYLVPTGKQWTSNAAAQTEWYGDNFALVGDNVRERPYADIYNKITTKSNTYTVHYHTQILQKTKTRQASDPTIFDTSAGDKVAATQRGSTTFERYLDPADPRIIAKDPASATATSLEEFYRARVVNTSIFNP